ncbi:hypothetical protein SK128_027601 [Halocaridina rubra]|uniref:Uncharacterized protein n=1 Tax=Halocaridina rubra TaxID=373956 RepID=A0AAN8XHE9_HALRR
MRSFLSIADISYKQTSLMSTSCMLLIGIILHFSSLPPDNKYHCDTRLKWLFKLRKETDIFDVRGDLDYVICYFEHGRLPPRLNGQTIPPISEARNSGPMVKLFDLLESELPNPVARMETANPVDDDTEQMKQDIHNKDAQNDKAPINDMIHSDKEKKGNHSFSPAQGEFGRGASAATFPEIEEEFITNQLRQIGPVQWYTSGDDKGVVCGCILKLLLYIA